MPDEIPENVDFHFLAAQNARILREMGEMREQTSLIPQMRRDIAELQVGQAAISVDLKAVKKDVEDLKKDVADLKETSCIIEGRLVRIEMQHGYVKA